MQRQAKQHPALDLLAVKRQAHAFVRVGRHSVTGGPGALLELLEHLLAICFKVLSADIHAVFAAFKLPGQFFDQRIDALAPPAGLRGRNQQLDGKICAVVQEIVFTQRAMARGFNRQRRLYARRIEALGFVDHIFIAAFKAVMLEMQRVLQKIGQLVRGHGIRNDRTARIPVQ